MSKLTGPGKLKNKAKECGVTPLELVQAALREHGTIRDAAVSLGVYDNTIRHWLRKAEVAR